MTTTYSNYEKHHTHRGIIDQDQMDVIFNRSKRLIVEAPAGYGKTKTMVSKIAFIIESNQLPNTKKILALTFSVNASLKIKNEILNQLSILITDQTALKLINQRVVASNYHGFGRHVLALYGFLIHPNLARINQFKVIDETNQHDLAGLQVDIDKRDFLKSYADSLRTIGKPSVDNESIISFLNGNFEQYVDILLKEFIPNDYLTYNGILLLTLTLFEKFPQVAAFYQSYFPVIFVDEFQDTNWLQWKMLCALTGREELPLSIRRLYLFGDRMQRIYGFIGAVPNIFGIAQDIFQMDLIKLKTNHRFAADSKLGKLDQILRANADNIRNPQIQLSADISIIENRTQTEIGHETIIRTQRILEVDSSSTLAILVRSGLKNSTTKEIYLALQKARINFFFALYKEDDQDYIDFHNTCAGIWLEGIKKGLRSIRSVQKFMNQELSKFPSNEVNSSLLVLLNLLIEKVQKKFQFLSFEEKSGIILETLASRGLKQHLDLVEDSRVILTTVHGAKGLEWDYVIMPDIQKFCFPPAPFCIQHNCANCNLDWSVRSYNFEQAFLEELSVFYVAVTRAKIDVLFLFSTSFKFGNGAIRNSPLSCLVKLPGLNPKNTHHNCQ